MNISIKTLPFAASVEAVSSVAVLGRRWDHLYRPGQFAPIDMLMIVLLIGIPISIYPLIMRGGQKMIDAEHYESLFFQLHRRQAVRAAQRFVVFGQCFVLFAIGVALIRLLSLIS